MTYEELLAKARGCMGPCKVCPVCNGLGCRNTIPGPGSKGSGTVANRNYSAWQDILINLDTISHVKQVDPSFELFGQKFSLPVFAAPIGVVGNHYGSMLDEQTYTEALTKGCMDAGIAAFTGDGLNEIYFRIGCQAMEKSGFAVPTVKPWHRDLVFDKIDFAKSHGAKMIAMDIDASGLPFLKKMTPPSGPKTVEEIREFVEYAGMPFILKGIMTPRGAEKAMEAGVSAIIVSNHGGRVLDHTPATAAVLPSIAETVSGRIPVLVDGGIRTGYDVFKALALGADAVLIGRPFVTTVYGAGAEGPGVYVNKLRGELCDAMEMTGCASLKDITKDVIWNG